MRTKVLAFVGAAAAGTLLRSVMAPPGPSDAQGLARALGAAVGGDVEADAFVWERSGGWLADALVGRGVVFVAHVEGPEGAQLDVFRTDVRLSREGRPLAIAEPTPMSRTPLADETSLVARGGKVAFASKHQGRFTGVSVLDVTSRCEACNPVARLGDLLAGRLAPSLLEAAYRRWAVAFPSPVERLELQWHDGGLELRAEDDALRLDLASHALTHSPAAQVDAVAWAIPAQRLTLAYALGHGASKAPAAPALEAAPRSTSAATLDEAASWPPRLEGESEAPWTMRVAGLDANAPALVTRDVVLASGHRVSLAALDTRQLELRAAGGYRWPHAVTGPGASGALPEGSQGEVVARLGAHPANEDDGFVERGRVLTPLSVQPSVVIDERGDAAIGRWPAGGVPGAGTTVVQGTMPRGQATRLAALCTTRSRQLLYAWSETIDPDALGGELDRQGCVSWVFFEPDDAPLVTGDATSAATPSAHAAFYLVKRSPTPSLDGVTALGAVPSPELPPTWLPAIHRSTLDRNQHTVTLTTVDVERFEWRVVVGQTEARGRTFDGALDEASAARVVLAIGLGVSEPGRRRGLALDGIVVTPFIADRAVAATHRPTGATAPSTAVGVPALELGLTTDGMAADADAAELVLLAEAGQRRSEARELGERRPRSALCMPSPGLLVYAEAVLDSPDLLVDALLELGCRRIVSTDRGRQLRAVFELRGQEGTPTMPPTEVALVGLARPALGRARWLGEGAVTPPAPR
jgi:hypothetical protein